MRQAKVPPGNWWQAPKRMTARQLARRLAPSIGLVPGPVTHVERVYLDTVDWRLFRRGEVLVDEADAGEHRTLVLQSRTTDRSDLVVRTSSRPRTASELPGGLRDRLAPVVEPRPLVDIGRERAEVWPLRMIDADGKTVARVDVERVECDDVDVIVRVHLRSVRGHDRITRQMRAALDAQADLSTADDPVVYAARAVGAEPGVESGPAPLRLDRAGRGVDALAAVLTHQLDTLIACEAGVRQQLDPEFLHDFRIAVRRTRSVVRLAALASHRGSREGVGERVAVARVDHEHARDLDVLLDEVAAARADLPAESKHGLDELERTIRTRRAVAQTALTKALLEDRYATLKRGWRAGITDLVGTPADATTTAALADELVARAMKQVVHRAEAVTVDSPVATVHDVRKRTKRLRYALDMFESVLDKHTIKTYQRATKRLQDDLGAFQDNVVYHERVTQLVDDSPGLEPDVQAVAAQLIARFDERNARARREVPAQLHRFVAEMSGASPQRP